MKLSQCVRLGPESAALGQPRLMHIASHGFYVPPPGAGAAASPDDVLGKTLENEVESDTKRGRGNKQRQWREFCAVCKYFLFQRCLWRRVSFELCFTLGWYGLL